MMRRHRMNLVQDGVEFMSVMVEEKRSCPRCHGFMVSVILDGIDAAMLNERESPARRCVNCGECIDPLILANRRGALT